MVRSRVDQASLWKTIMILALGISLTLLIFMVLHLERIEHNNSNGVSLLLGLG